MPGRQGTGLLGLIAVGVITLVVFTGIFRKPFQDDSRKVVAEFTRAGQLHKGDDVRVNGEVAGFVSAVEPSDTADHARVTLEVNDDAGPLYNDARVRIRAQTLLAGAFYVEVDRGSPAFGSLGDSVIPVDRTHVQVELEDVTDIFRDRARQGFLTLPRELRDAFANAGAVADVAAATNDVAPEAATALQALRGSAPGFDMPKLVTTAARTAQALTEDDGALRALVSGAARTLEVTGNRRGEIAETIDASPGVASDLTTTLRRLDSTLAIADGLVTRLEPGVPELAPTLRRLRPTLLGTSRLLDASPLFFSDLRNLLVGVGPAAAATNPVLDALDPSFRRLDRTILPYINRKDPDTGRSTAVMIGGFGAAFAGVAGSRDSMGHTVRFPATIGTSSAYTPCRSSLVDPDAAAVLACDELDTALNNYLEYLPELSAEGPGR
jgi:phospholipid/cholesterol/gamma-HCH transport system substrate-binding protein